jgi:choline dehydrogenase-like flavoprotein
MQQAGNKEVEYLVVGTGPGGATVARQLAAAGKSVLMLERGPRHPEKSLGFPFGVRVLDGFGILSKSKEGVYIARGITVGGSSLVFNGNVYDPPKALMKAMGIDFSQEAQELRREIGVNVLPDRYFENSTGLKSLLAAGEKLGYSFTPQDKFIDPEKCLVGCDSCMMGCQRSAKWTTRIFVDEAIANGARLEASTPVEKLIMENGRVKGVLTRKGKSIRAQNVILAAGGIGTPGILLRSGIKTVGSHFFMDPMNLILGRAKNQQGGAYKEMTFTHTIDSFKESDGFIISNLSSFSATMPTIMRSNVFLKNFWRTPALKRAIGLFVKLADSPQGRVSANERLEKPFPEYDRTRMAKGTAISKEILLEAGIDPKSISVAEWIGGHPGGTAAMGRFVDKNFSSEINGLFVCDGSVMPQSPGVPPTLTILAMSKLLGKMLLGQVKPEERAI